MSGELAKVVSGKIVKLQTVDDLVAILQTFQQEGRGDFPIAIANYEETTMGVSVSYDANEDGFIAWDFDQHIKHSGPRVVIR